MKPTLGNQWARLRNETPPLSEGDDQIAVTDNTGTFLVRYRTSRVQDGLTKCSSLSITFEDTTVPTVLQITLERHAAMYRKLRYGTYLPYTTALYRHSLAITKLDCRQILG
jgi:hypothetical protein